MVVKFLKEHKWIILAMAVALLVRVLLIIFNPRYSIQEDWELESLSQNLFHGLGYKYTNAEGMLIDYWIYPPGISVLYSFVYLIMGIGEYSFTGLRVLQSVIDIFGCLAVYIIGKELFSKKVGILAGYLYAIFLPIAFMATFAAHDALIPFFCAVILCLFVLGIKRNKIGYYIGSGIVCGISCYFQPVTIMLPIALGFCSMFYFIGKESLKRVLLQATKRTLIMFIVMAVIVTPYIVRNAFLSGTVSPMRSTAWATIYLGWGEDPNNEFGIVLNDWIEIDKASEELGHPLIFGSTEYESYYRNKVITIAKEHPDFLLKTIIRRMLITFVYPSDLGISYPKETDGTPLSPAKTPSEEYKKSYPTISESIKMILDGSIITYASKYLHLIFYILVVFISALAPLALSVLSVYLRRDRWREFMLIGSLPIYFSLVSLLILSVSTKAKLPECVSYMVMSSVAIWYLYDFIRYKKHKAT